MSDKDLTEFSKEGQGFDEALNEPNGTEQPEKEDSEESSTETNQGTEEESPTSETEEESKQDENVPFHQHPRWKEVYQKAKKVDELEAEIALLKAPKTEIRQDVTQKPKWFTDIYGDNEPAWTDYQRSQEAVVKQAEERAIERIEAKQRMEAERTAKSNAYIQESIAELKESGHQFDENKLLKIMAEYRPVDESGTMWDFKRGYEIYQLLEKKPSADAKKRIAAATGKSKSESEEEEVKIWTPSKLRERYGTR